VRGVEGTVLFDFRVSFTLLDANIKVLTDSGLVEARACVFDALVVDSSNVISANTAGYHWWPYETKT
jgi:hypothetical protein